MIFHSFDFVAFFILFVAAYWRLPHRGQNVLLLIGSYVFYGWVHPWFLSLIFISTVADYWAARWMEDHPARRRTWLGLSLVVNLGMLGFFKYFNFFAENVQAFLALLQLDVPMTTLRVVLPVGISFYTFQELSYTLEVYRGTLRARRNFIDFATFVCFFPQLVAGPIERASHLLPQVEAARRFAWPAAANASCLILWGYFQKMVVADNAGVIANKVFALREPGFHVLWAGVFAFGIQIFADFSAYSDIARGTARWLGFDLMRNFNLPYLATGPADFWRRWHISLSSWFRDYVYIPLGGSRQGRWREYRNLMLTFLLSGLWHGASWNFVMWGAYHGALVVAGRALAALRVSGPCFLRNVIGLLDALRPAVLPFRVAGMFVLTTIGWLFFREGDTAALLRSLTLSPAASTPFDRTAGAYLLLLAAGYSIPLWLYAAWRPEWPSRPAGRLVAGTVLAGVLLTGIVFLRSRQSLDFIYFQF